MKRYGLYLFLIIILLLPSISCSHSTTTTTSIPTTTRYANFNFIFKYGVSARNVLDTFQNTFTKDMVVDSPITIEMSLTQEEMDLIYQKMVDINFFNFPSEFNDRIPFGEETTTIVTPGYSYNFKTQVGQIIKELNWDAGRIYEDQLARDLESLTQLIIEIIQSKDEYKRLPEPTSAYM